MGGGHSIGHNCGTNRKTLAQAGTENGVRSHGLEIPVIFTCRADAIDKIHFDTRQYSHIAWDSTSELRNSLRDRILARIGEGPNLIQ